MTTRNHVQHGDPPYPPPSSHCLEVHLKHFTWGFIKNAAICLNRESYIRERTRAHTHAHTHTDRQTRSQVHAHIRSLHTKIISLQVHQACFQRFWGYDACIKRGIKGGSSSGKIPCGDASVWGWRSLAEPRVWLALTLSLIAADPQVLSSPERLLSKVAKRSSPESLCCPPRQSSVIFYRLD